MEAGFFQVTLKVLLYDGSGRLLILKDKESQAGDLPGGRLSIGELYESWSTALAREITEELGEAIRYEVDALPFCYRPHRILNGNHPALCFFYRGKYLSGEIALSAEHDALDWIEPAVYDFKSWFQGTMLDSLLALNQLGLLKSQRPVLS